MKSKDEGNPIAVLFIHGLGSAADRWMDLPEAISYYFNVFALDLGALERVTNLHR